jgi:putative NADH-flavin reductase
MKTIAIFGASGETGQELVKQVLKRGWAVKALCRRRSALRVHDVNLLMYEGEITLEACKELVCSADAVVCALGQRPNAMQPFCAEATATILKAMKECGVERFICITGAMVGERNAAYRSWFIRQMANAFRKKMPKIAHDREQQENIIAESGMKWTVVKPPRLSNSVAYGNYKIGENIPVSVFSHIGRADVGAFILQSIEDTSTFNKFLVVKA